MSNSQLTQGNNSMASLYIHIPFCLGKCEYCSFNSYAGMEALYPRYVKALKKEIVECFFSGKSQQLETVFLGGGTPSILSAEQIANILACCQEYLGIDEGAEISLEVNPKTVDFMKLLQLRQAGINRLSIGVQSFVDSELAMLGRLHTVQEGWDCVRDAIGAGFANISLDLIYGIPGQTADLWRWNVETALSLGISHLSLYQLTIEENTPFATQHEQGLFDLPNDEEVLEMDEISFQLCKDAGLEQYEISNFSMEGFECKHNINYWHNFEYLAVGAGGVGYIQGVRSLNIGDPLEYCKAVEDGSNLVAESEKLDAEGAFRESVVMGLRMTKGVPYSTLYDRFGLHLREYYGDTLTPLLDNGFAEFTDTHFRLTKKGRQLANQVLAELV